MLDRLLARPPIHLDCQRKYGSRPLVIYSHLQWSTRVETCTQPLSYLRQVIHLLTEQWRQVSTWSRKSRSCKGTQEIPSRKWLSWEELVAQIWRRGSSEVAVKCHLLRCRRRSQSLVAPFPDLEIWVSIDGCPVLWLISDSRPTYLQGAIPWEACQNLIKLESSSSRLTFALWVKPGHSGSYNVPGRWGPTLPCRWIVVAKISCCHFYLWYTSGSPVVHQGFLQHHLTCAHISRCSSVTEQPLSRSCHLLTLSTRYGYASQPLIFP